MKQSIREKLDQLSLRLSELDLELSSPDMANDMSRLRELTRERAEIEPAAALYQELCRVEADCDGAREMLEDDELRELAQSEIEQGRARLAQIEDEVMRALLPRDPDDDRNVYLEVRAGTGGAEAALFAGDLLRMYIRYAEKQGWQVDIVSATEAELGGYKEVVACLSGSNVYARMKFESGAHRVQRVPATETQGRIHTSACTVAVLPEAAELDAVSLNPADLRIDTFRASGAGGQHVNKTDSAIRVTHVPTGMVVECQDNRSQHRNRAQALAVMAARMQDAQRHEQQADEAAARKRLVGSGDRSERIRTYNYPQGRVTDHRINLTLYKLDAIMEGELDELIDTLVVEHQADLLAELTGD